MPRFALVVLAFTVLASTPTEAQTGAAAASGQCSLANSASDASSFRIDCGTGKEQADKILSVLNHALANKDSKAIDAKLDELLAVANRPVDKEIHAAPISQSSTGDCSPNNVRYNKATNCDAPPHVTASVQRTVRSNEPNGLWVTSFTLKADKATTTGDLKLTCSGPCVRAAIGHVDSYAFMRGGTSALDPSDPNTVVYEESPEPMASGQVVRVAVYSKAPVKVVSGLLGGNAIEFRH
jgi:hypothetical protein